MMMMTTTTTMMTYDVTEDGDADSEVYWQQTTVEREHNWYNVSRLLHGRTYWLRVAAVDRHGDMMKSDYVEVVVGIHPGIQPGHNLLGCVSS